jgi:hypothetical protein
MRQRTFEEVIDAEIEEAISIAEEEIPCDIRSAYTEASSAKQKKVARILMDIMAINDDTERDEDDKSLAIFAKVLKLETVLGLC